VVYYKVCWLNKAKIDIEQSQIKCFKVIEQFFEKQQSFLNAILIRCLNLQPFLLFLCDMRKLAKVCFFVIFLYLCTLEIGIIKHYPYSLIIKYL